MKKRIVLLISVIMSLSAFAQEGKLTNKDIEKIRASFDANDVNNKARMNAISANDIKKLAGNREVAGKIDHQFKYKVKVNGITDQESSGRCWMFTALNGLRPQVIEKYSLSGFEFSQNYLYFWDQMEKSNLFLEGVIKHSKLPMDERINDWLFSNPIGDGGVWNSFANLVDKYGLVPKSVMPETQHSSNTSFLSSLIKRKLREDGLELRDMMERKSTTITDIRKRKVKMMQDIYRILSLALGEPPTNFTYRFIDKDGNIGEWKEYTPLSFYKELFPEYNTAEYVMLMNDPTREYYKLYEIEYDRNVMEGRNWTYINLPNDEFKKFAIESIKTNEAIYASCDVGKQLNKKEGTLNLENYDYEALFNVKFGMDKKQRILTHDSGSSHAMLLMAVDVDENEKPTMWQFENSWGSSYGHNGYLTFTDDWWENYMFRIVVNKKFLDKKTLKVLDQQPIKLPPWDPMFLQDN